MRAPVERHAALVGWTDGRPQERGDALPEAPRCGPDFRASGGLRRRADGGPPMRHSVRCAMEPHSDCQNGLWQLADGGPPTQQDFQRPRRGQAPRRGR
jgi:hypothetical protein